MATPDSPVFELLDKLLRLVAHAFHSPGSILVLETLIRLKRDELPIKDEELAARIKLQARQVRSYIQELKSGGLVRSDVKVENRGQALSHSEFVFIDYKLAVNAIRYRILMLQEDLEKNAKKREKIGYYTCTKCNEEHDQMEALSKFLNVTDGHCYCPKCKQRMTIPRKSAAEQSRQQIAQFNTQITPIIEVLKMIDGLKVPLLKYDLPPDPSKPKNKTAAGAAASASNAGSAVPSAAGTPNTPKNSEEDANRRSSRSTTMELIDGDIQMRFTFEQTQAVNPAVSRRLGDCASTKRARSELNVEEAPKRRSTRAPPPWMRLRTSDKSESNGFADYRLDNKRSFDSNEWLLPRGRDEIDDEEYLSIFYEKLQYYLEKELREHEEEIQPMEVDDDIQSIEVYVCGELKSIIEITEIDQVNMSRAEYEDYFDKLKDVIFRISETHQQYQYQYQ